MSYIGKSQAPQFFQGIAENLRKLLVRVQESAFEGPRSDAHRSLIEYGMEALGVFPQGLGCDLLLGDVEKINGQAVAGRIGADLEPGIQRRVEIIEFNLHLF